MSELPLSGLRIIDCSTVVAGPRIAMYMADFGADVVKVEHPQRGDDTRRLGAQKDGVSSYWKLLSRNKRHVTLSLSSPKGQEIARRLFATADVLIENFRPGTLERWNLAPDDLLRDNPRLVIARVTGFGQDGPYARRPGFATLAEAMSGLASITGEPGGPPLLPPIALADEVTGLVGTWAVLAALYWRDARGGTGQVIDLSLYESLIQLLGPLPIAWDQLKYLQPRMGSRLPYSAPRNAYQCKDGKWVALSASAESVAPRVFDAIGRPELKDDPRFATHHQRVEHVVELDGAIQEWMSQHTRDEALAIFERYHAALAPVYEVSEFFDDPHVAARGSLATVDDPDWGPIRMQGVHPRMSETPGRIENAGPSALGTDNAEVYGELGIGPDELEQLAREGVV
ncbi:MAG TPA: CoA transferase [Actinomycetota bacterium]|nr:CoA transferase [Actinomycetota bacterium]